MNSAAPSPGRSSSCGWAATQRAKSSGSITMTVPPMRAWSVPQNSAQNSRYSPGFVARNHISVKRPGSTSCFSRKAGTKKLWITSCEVITSRIGLAARDMQGVDLARAVGVRVFHIHCLATTCISSAPGGGSLARSCAAPAHQNRNSARKSVAAVQPISRSRRRNAGRSPRGAAEPRR